MKLLDLCTFASTRKAEYKHLLRPHLPLMHSKALAWSLSRSEADHLLQEVLVQLTPQLETLRKIDNLGAWLLAYLYNFISSHYCRQEPAYLVAETSRNGIRPVRRTPL